MYNTVRRPDGPGTASPNKGVAGSVRFAHYDEHGSRGEPRRQRLNVIGQRKEDDAPLARERDNGV